MISTVTSPARPRLRPHGPARSSTGARRSHLRSLRTSIDDPERVVAAMRAGPDRDRLIEDALPLVGAIARLYRGTPSIERSELIQAGVVGVLRALDRFDPELGTPFWAYASWWVRHAMQQLVSELTGPVVLSDRAVRRLARVKDAQSEYLRRHGREPSARELALYTGVPLEHVDGLLAARRPARGLEEAADRDRAGGQTVGDLLPDPASEQAYERASNLIAAERLPELLELLTARERAVIWARYGLDGRERTLREVGAALGLSAERVRQVEHAALEKLWHAATTGRVRTGGDRDAG